MFPLRDRSAASPAVVDPSAASSIPRNITWLTAGSVLVKPLWLVFITAFCMQVLGSSGYGIMTAALSLMAIAAVFSDLGTTEYSIREVARSRQTASAYFSNLLAARGVLTAAALAAALGLGWLLGYRGGAMVALAFAGVYAMALRLTEFCRGFYRSFEVLRLEAVSLIVEKVFVIGFGLVALWRTRTPAGTLGGMAVGMTVALALNVAWIHRHLTPLRRAALEWPFVRHAFRVALPLGMYGLFTLVFTGSGPVLLEALAGEAAAGFYGAAYRILEALQLLPVVVGAATLPRLSSLFHQRQIGAFEGLVRRSLLGLGLVSACIALAVSVLSPMVMHLLDPSSEFEQAGYILRVLIWAFPLLAVNYGFTMALIASDQQRFLAMLYCGGAGAIVLLNLVLIPDYAYYGTVAALLAGVATMIVCCGWRYRYVTRRAALPAGG